MRYDSECIEIGSSTGIEHANNFDGFRVFIVMFFSAIDVDPQKMWVDIGSRQIQHSRFHLQ